VLWQQGWHDFPTRMEQSTKVLLPLLLPLLLLLLMMLKMR
jgi:hypothetical protein